MKKIPLLFKDRRLEGNSTLRQCQLVQLHLLYVFDAICKENNLTYFLGGGTLLGAMRHDGFIPWDDDLDVGMSRKDYEKFLKIADKVLPRDVILQSPQKAPHLPVFYSKLRDCYSFYFETSEYLSTLDNLGVFIDIFPYDEVPNVRHGLKQFLFKVSYHGKWRTVEFRRKMSVGFFSAWYYSLKYLFWILLNGVVTGIIKLLKMIFKPKTATLGFCFPLFKEFRIESLYPTVNHIFEDGRFPIPNNSNDFLQTQYGNWREIPPPDKRPRHATIILPMTTPKVPWAMEYPHES